MNRNMKEVAAPSEFIGPVEREVYLAILSRPRQSMQGAIATHREAWQALQDAPDSDAMRAEDIEGDALGALLATPPRDFAELQALLDFLAWYTTEEIQRSGKDDIQDLPFTLYSTLKLATECCAQVADQHTAEKIPGSHAAYGHGIARAIREGRP